VFKDENIIFYTSVDLLLYSITGCFCKRRLYEIYNADIINNTKSHEPLTITGVSITS
jgi:hypothetical protein